MLEKLLVQHRKIIRDLAMRRASDLIYDDIDEDSIQELTLVEDGVRTLAPMGNCGSGSVTPSKSSINSIIRPRKEGGSCMTTPKSGYNMVDYVSESMVDSIENKKVKYE